MILLLIVVTPYKPLDRQLMETILERQTLIDYLLIRTPISQDEQYQWIKALIEAGFSKGKVMIHTDVALAERLNIRNIHFREGDVHAEKTKRMNPSYHVTMSVHDEEHVRLAHKWQLDFGIYGHLFPSNSKKGKAPRTDAEITKALDIGFPLVAIGGINMNTIHQVPQAFIGFACIEAFFSKTKQDMHNLLEKWVIHKERSG
ncbi:thiamine phosphate synthase [Staphylococcus massiliensis]|uniref:thiamine phosphate synthase n=1 Tax=Staphylococcus massiliensis TaxID=555791 RepID=UPI001F0C92EB|nr:thiamine phosphate synthase [Staphylococcus massiliensis]